MTKTYLYGVVHATEHKKLGSLGLSTDGASEQICIHCVEGLGVAYAKKEIEEDDFPASRKNLVNHQRVVELLLEQEGDVLPFAFGTFVADVQQIEELLRERNAYFDSVLAKISGKIEVNIKANWQEMQPIFEAIMSENETIRTKRAQLMQHHMHDHNERISLGKMVEEALKQSKDEKLKEIVDKLKPLSIAHKVQQNITDSMFANVAFFLHKTEEKSFDKAVHQMGEQLGENVFIKYIGPTAPVNFLE